MTINRLDYLRAQVLASHGQVMYWHASAVSGAYKLRKIYHGTGGPELTEEEKLKDCLEILQRHVHRIGELSELLAEEPRTGFP